jgi:hypothetical protein
MLTISLRIKLVSTVDPILQFGAWPNVISFPPYLLAFRDNQLNFAAPCCNQFFNVSHKLRAVTFQQRCTFKTFNTLYQF